MVQPRHELITSAFALGIELGEFQSWFMGATQTATTDAILFLIGDVCRILCVSSKGTSMRSPVTSLAYTPSWPPLRSRNSASSRPHPLGLSATMQSRRATAHNVHCDLPAQQALFSAMVFLKIGSPSAPFKCRSSLFNARKPAGSSCSRVRSAPFWCTSRRPPQP